MKIKFLLLFVITNIFLFQIYNYYLINKTVDITIQDYRLENNKEKEYANYSEVFKLIDEFNNLNLDEFNNIDAVLKILINIQYDLSIEYQYVVDEYVILLDDAISNLSYNKINIWLILFILNLVSKMIFSFFISLKVKKNKVLK